MPVYRVQAPDGKILKIEGPKNASQDQLIQAAKEYYDAAFQPAKVEPEKPGILQQIGEQAVGAGEAALTTATGATAGLVGMIGGTLKGLAEQILNGQFGTQEAAQLVQQAASEGAQEFTYQPRTKAGKDQVEAMGKVGEILTPLGPMAAQFAPMVESAPALSTIARGTVEPRVASVANAVKNTAGGIVDAMVGDVPATSFKIPDTSVGAMQTPMAAQRVAQAESLGFTGPAGLTEGQKTRDFAQQRFEKETAKSPDVGAPLRERALNQNAHISHLVDNFIESTGGEVPDLRSIGLSVDKALQTRAAKDKAKIRTLYKEAEKRGETARPIDPSAIIEYLNKNKSAESTATVLKTAKNELIRLGGARLDGNGDLVPLTDKKPRRGRPPKVPRPDQPVGMTLANAEQLRQLINKTSGSDRTNMTFGSELKKVIDASTEGSGGEYYGRARAARAKFARDYEDVGLVSDLMGTKPGSSDRAVALENVFQQVVLSPSTSLDSMRHVKRLLQTKSDNGGQAWKDIQAATLQHIKDEITKNVARDERGNPIISPAKLDTLVKSLDKSGKLDYIFGPQGAEKIRTLNDVAKDVLVTVPGAVNTSNTASVIAAMMDTALSGTAGVPLPVLTGFKEISKRVKDSKTKARIAKALGETK